MGQVTVSVNGRRYTIGCDDGEEDHVEYLAEFVDRRVREMAEAVGQVGEDRLMLMAALLIAEDLEGAYSELETARRGGNAAGGATAVAVDPAANPGAGRERGQPVQGRLGLDARTPEKAVEALAMRLEGIVARLEST